MIAKKLRKIEQFDQYHLPRLLHSTERLCCALIIPAIIILTILIIVIINKIIKIIIITVILMIKEKLTDSQRSRSAGKSHLKFRSPRISYIHTSSHIYHHHQFFYFGIHCSLLIYNYIVFEDTVVIIQFYCFFHHFISDYKIKFHRSLINLELHCLFHFPFHF